jgi:hypothetical protein
VALDGEVSKCPTTPGISVHIRVVAVSLRKAAIIAAPTAKLQGTRLKSRATADIRAAS